MRILAIRGENLASFEGPYEIDLESGVLAAAGLFAICGPTGAGKSTILDTMCLALFGKTPRLIGERDTQREKRKVARERIGQEAPDGDDLAATDARQLLRKGAAKGFAECDFVGVGGKRYRARWEVRRARNRAQGRIQVAEQTLMVLDATAAPIPGRSGDILAEIRERLGLDFEQFRRSALLAQGEFAAFLRASGKERASLLERVTGSELYSKLSVASFEKRRDVQAQVDLLEQRLAGIALLDPQEQVAVAQQVQTLREQIAQTEQDRAMLTQAQLWHRQQHTLEQTCKDARNKLEEAETRLRALAEQESEVAIWQQVRPHLHGLQSYLQQQSLLAERRRAYDLEHAQLQQALVAKAQALATEQERRAALELVQSQLAEARPRLEPARLVQAEIGRLLEVERERGEAATRSRNEIERLTLEVARVDEERLRLENEIAAVQAVIGSHQDLAEVETEFALIRDRLQGYLHARERIVVLEREAEKIRLEGASLAPARAKLLETCELLAGQLRGIAAQEAELEAQLSAVDRTRLAASLDRMRGYYQTLGTLEGLYGALEQRQAAARGLEVEEQQVEKELLHAKADAEELLRRATIARAQVDGALLAGRALAKAPSFDEARRELVQGEACPLCGSTLHPWAQGDDVRAAVRAYEEQTGLLQQAANDAHQRALSQVTVVSQHEAKRASLRARAQQERTLEQQAASQLSAALSAFRADAQLLVELAGVDAEAAATLASSASECAKLRVGVQEVGTRLRDEQQRNLQHDEKLRALRKQKDELQVSLAHEKNALHATQLREQASLEQSVRLHSDLEGQRGAVSQSRSYLQRVLAVRTEFLGKLDDAPSELLSLLHDVFATLTTARGRLAELNLKQRRIEQEKLAQAGRYEAVRLQCSEIESEVQRVQAEIQAQRGRLVSLVGEQDPDAVLRDFAAQIEARGQELAQAQAVNAAVQQEATRAIAVEELRRREIDQLVAALCRQREELDAALSASALSLEHAIGLLPRTQTLDELTQRCARVRNERDVLQRDLQRSAAQLLEHEQSRPVLSAQDVDSTLALVQEQRDRAIAQATVLDQRIQRDREARASSEEVVAQLTRLRDRLMTWQRLADLIGHNSGDKFRNFAQGLAFDALVGHANAHLEQLDRRYRLEKIPGSVLEMQVVDRAMADEIRSVHSLSGGETFLVSLALALGLSTMSATNQPVESLFIDEGFGTLDREALERAMSALEALQAGGRKVGIISHVEGLAEQIGVVVEVRPCGAGRSRLRVRELRAGVS